MELQAYHMVARNAFGRVLLVADVQAFTLPQANAMFWSMVTGKGLDMVCASFNPEQ